MSSQYNQNATYWEKATINEYNEYTYSAPTIINVRWEDAKVVFNDATGREIMSDAIVYPEINLDIEGFLFLGESVAINPISEDLAYEIKQTETTVNLKNTKTLYKVYLKK